MATREPERQRPSVQPEIERVYEPNRAAMLAALRVALGLPPKPRKRITDLERSDD